MISSLSERVRNQSEKRCHQSRRKRPSFRACSVSAVCLWTFLHFYFANALVGHSIRSFSSSARSIASRRTISSSSTTAVFGIKGFRAWFESQFPDAITGIPSKGSQESFDHVLIDINQLLHVAVRRSTSDDHALAILMKELNACIELATPTKSLVLAMDGPPSAAKLAASRKRRLSTLFKSEWKQAQLARVQRSPKLKLNSHKEKRLRQRYAAEVETLRITPGTHFMERANQAMLYWAWQRMISQDGPLAKVAIYISTSDSPGEGEVKILDWILRKQPHGTLAIMGGDSDLVLEGLVIPPSICTHNVFVLLPGLGKRYLVVSLWETTRHLAQLLPQLKAEDIMRVRTDMVLLLILNGNDYLPKLRGSSGFNRVFRAYIQVVREWLEEGKENLFLVDPDSLTFHLEFAADFFGRLKLDRPLESAANIAELQLNVISPLGQLNNLVSTQFMPKPMRWKIIYEDAYGEAQVKIAEDVDTDDELDDNEHDDDDIVDFTEDDVIEEIEKEGSVFGEDDDDDDELLMLNGGKSRAKLRLTLGKPGTSDFHCYETTYYTEGKIKDRKNELAKIALEDLLGGEFLEGSADTFGLTPPSYSWELNFPVDGDCKLYLGGLLWNLQTYQDGICPDYSYNYGKRLSPTAEDLVDFFQQAIAEGRAVGKKELLSSTFTPPVKNGVSCLAALPSQLGSLIAEPYSLVSSERVESFYAECVSRDDNTFDIRKFSELCEAEIAKFDYCKKKSVVQNDEGLKPVPLGEDYWTVVFRSFKPLDAPFAPPPPVIEKFTPLFVNRRIKAARFAASTVPRERSVWSDSVPFLDKKSPSQLGDIDHCGIGDLLASSKDGRSVFDVDFSIPYPKLWGKKSLKKNAVNVDAPNSSFEGNSMELKQPQVVYDLAIDQLESSGHQNGASPLAYLTELEQANMISLEWKPTMSSFMNDASMDPDAVECLELVIRKGSVPITSTFEEELVFQISREAERRSTLPCTHDLASMALTALLRQTGKKWFEMSYSEIKSLLDANAQTQSERLYEHDINDAAKSAIPIEPTSSTLINDSDAAKGLNRKRRKRLSDSEIEQRIKEFNLEVDGSRHPHESRTGVTPVAYLAKLEQADMLDFEWKSTIPSPSDFASVSPHEFESVQLIVRKGDAPINCTFTRELRFQRDREITRGSKQQVKQYLASAALTRLLARKSKKWYEMSFVELKNMLIPDYEIIRKPRLLESELKQRMIEFNMKSTISTELSISQQSALEYLGQLHSDQIISATFNFTYPSPTKFASVAPEDFELVQLVVTIESMNATNPNLGELRFERDRLIGRDQKRVKQFLAALALGQLLEQELPWTEFTYEEYRSRLSEVIPAKRL